MENVSSPASGGPNKRWLLVAGLLSPIARRNGLTLIPTFLVLLLVAANITNPWNPRPELANLACFAVMILLLQFAFKGWRGNWWLKCDARLMRQDMTVPFEANCRRLGWLWLSVPLMVFWANAHGGFVAGYAMLSFYLICRGLELASQRGWTSLPTQRYFALILLTAGLATFLNPYGHGLHQWLLAAIGNRPPVLTQWHPMGSWGAQGLAFAALILATILCPLFSRRPVDFTHNALLLVAACQACNHPRHTPYFAVLFGFWVFPHVESVWHRITVPLKQRNPRLDSLDRGEPHSNPEMRLRWEGLVRLWLNHLARLWNWQPRFDNPQLAEYSLGEFGDTPPARPMTWRGFPASSNGKRRLASYSAPQQIATKAEE